MVYGIEGAYVPLSSGPSAGGAAAVVNIPRRSGYRVQIGNLIVSYSAAPAGGRVTAADADVPKLDNDIVAGGVTTIPIPGDGVSFEASQAVTITAAGGGGAIVAKVSTCYRYIADR